MTRFLCGLAITAALLTMPQSASAQTGGAGGGQMGLTYNPQLGPPPAGVFLHQQYMQLYGLPVNFQQNSQLYNNNQASGGGGYGGYPGGGYGGQPRLFGVNYQRQVAAIRAAQASYPTVYSSSSGPTTASAGFGMGNSSYSPSFVTNATPSMTGATGFSGFGVANSFSDPATKADVKEEKKDEKKVSEK